MYRSFWSLVVAALTLVACESGPGPTAIVPGAETRLVPAGWFLMGENDGRESNQPQHWVYLDAFEIQLTEVTRSEYSRFLSKSGTPAPGFQEPGGDKSGNLPVVGVAWRDADAYCRWFGMRLPTEAEWEKAARGEEGRRYPWGNEWDQNKANTVESGVGDVLPVGSFPESASPYGLLDMCGNASEWVGDYYDPAYYTYAPERNPTGPVLILDHVLRGGSFDSLHEQATTYFRDSSHSVLANVRVGFRCARSLNQTAVP